MTLVEYHLRMEAYQLQRVAEQRNIMMQAFANQLVKSTKGSKNNPKPKYTKFEQLFNEEKEIDKVRSSFELDYVSVAKDELNPEKIFAKRLAEYKKMKAERLSSSNSKKRGG